MNSTDNAKTNIRKNNLTGSFMLLLTSLIWGFAFSFQVEAAKYLQPITINGIRMMLGFLTLLPIAVATKNLVINKKSAVGGILCGICLFVASILQQLGVGMYSKTEAAAGKSGFISALYIVFVPFLSFALFKIKLKKSILISVALALLGMYLLCVKKGVMLSSADIFILLSAMSYAAHILVVDRFVKVANPLTLSCFQLFVCGLLGITAMFIFETPTIANIKSALFPLVFIGIFSSGIAYTLQLTGQKRITEPAAASLLMSLESVFAAISGFLLLGERLTLKEFIGCILVFVAVILAQMDIKSLFRKKSQLIK